MHSKFARSVSLRPARLTTYLTGAVGSSFLIAAPQAEAAITSITFGFGSVLNLNSNLLQSETPILPLIENFGSMYVDAGTYHNGAFTEEFITLGLDALQNKGSFYFENLVEPNAFYGKAKFLAQGKVVGDTTNGKVGQATFSSPFGSDFNITTNQTNKFLGFLTSAGNWGWTKVSWNATTKQLTFHSAYVESVAGNTIAVGDTGVVPEPSRALLALAGLGAAALRRRRKQVA
jgi:MYXO-CTERM domain-containing protein